MRTSTRHRHAARAIVAGLAAMVAATGLVTTTAAPAHAGQVGVTVGIQGAGAVTAVEGSLEDGAAATCIKYHNKDHRVTAWCDRVRNSEALEAWVWLRPTALSFPAGEWRFDGWSGCDSYRVREGITECAVHSGAFSSDERYPVARFRDVVAPTVSDLTVTQVPDVDRQFRLTFGVSDGPTECRVVGVAEWAPCVSGHPASAPEGIRRFEVRATDTSGNIGTASVEVPVVDTAIASGPSSYTSNRAASFSLRSEAGETFWCSFDFRDWSHCGDGPSTGFTLVGDDGVHSLRVRARTDSWVDPVPAEWRWTIDTQAPTTTIVADTSGTAATFTFDADEASYYQCRLDTPAGEGHWLWCQSPATYSGLAQGPHTFSVKAMDRAGNGESAPPAHRWTVDTVAPATTLVASASADRATFAFSAPGATSYECRLTSPSGSGQWSRCTSPTSYADLPAGQHRFEVRATDAAGNVEAVPVSHSWTATRPAPAPTPDPVPGPGADTTPPETSLTSGPSGFVLAPTATFGLAGEPGATYRCTLDGASVPCGPSLSLSGLRSGTHTLVAAAVDAHGNVDPTPVARTWTVPATASELRIARGWQLRRTASAYGGSRLEATRRGAQLSASVRGATSIALVVGKGRRHGSVKVYAGSRLLRTVRLAAPRNASRVVVPVTAFATPYTGRLRVVVATQGRPVRIEGLGVATG